MEAAVDLPHEVHGIESMAASATATQIKEAQWRRILRRRPANGDTDSSGGGSHLQELRGRRARHLAQ
eukprot:10152670-Prorocentrum_lima.AAC.1